MKKKVEVVEETGPIPEKKDYGDKVTVVMIFDHTCLSLIRFQVASFQVEEPPAKKAKRSGPVKISIPSLSTFKDEEDEGGHLPSPPKTFICIIIHLGRPLTHLV